MYLLASFSHHLSTVYIFLSCLSACCVVFCFLFPYLMFGSCDCISITCFPSQPHMSSHTVPSVSCPLLKWALPPFRIFCSCCSTVGISAMSLILRNIASFGWEYLCVCVCVFRCPTMLMASVSGTETSCSLTSSSLCRAVKCERVIFFNHYSAVLTAHFTVCKAGS